MTALTKEREVPHKQAPSQGTGVTGTGTCPRMAPQLRAGLPVPPKGGLPARRVTCTLGVQHQAPLPLLDQDLQLLVRRLQPRLVEVTMVDMVPTAMDRTLEAMELGGAMEEMLAIKLVPATLLIRLCQVGRGLTLKNGPRRDRLT
uniref:Uncharacterized protein n=1 Tax=Timema douglasi TaxID=61478 RepID=A0A7R8Z7I6_TIMDO|nr:unnamed protein product [Timema douglasi]